MVVGIVGGASALPNRDEVRSGFGLSIDIAVLSMLTIGEFERDEVRSGFWLSNQVKTLFNQTGVWKIEQ
jgi:hypothetical protein